MSENQTPQEQAIVDKQEQIDNKAKELEALEKRANEICKTCKGKRSEHTAKTRHMFAEEEGVLMTQAQADKAAKQQQQVKPTVIQLPGMSQGHSTITDRLLKVLLQKELINKDEALFVLGVGPEPQPASGYRDPAMHPVQHPRSSKFKMVGGEPSDGDGS